MDVRRVFVSPEEGRLRLGWRLLAQFVTLLLLSAVFASVVLPVAGRFGGDVRVTTAQVAMFGGTVISVYLARRFLDRRSFVSLGLKAHRQGMADLLFGFLLGGAVMALLFGIEWAVGWVKRPACVDRRLEVGLAALLALVHHVMVGFQEEVLARGYWLQNMAEEMRLRWAVVISAVIFAVGHLGNEGANLLAALSLFGAGVLLAYGWIRTGQLWLSIGLHIGWNFFEGAFGFPVSGMGGFYFLSYRLQGPEVLVGGSFGPESGLFSFLMMAIAGGAIHWWSRKRNGAGRLSGGAMSPGGTVT